MKHFGKCHDFIKGWGYERIARPHRTIFAEDYPSIMKFNGHDRLLEYYLLLLLKWDNAKKFWCRVRETFVRKADYRVDFYFVDRPDPRNAQLLKVLENHILTPNIQRDVSALKDLDLREIITSEPVLKDL